MRRYRADEHLPYFCTITVLDWLPVLVEASYMDPIIESLRFCRHHKGLELPAFAVMPNHLHLIAVPGENLHSVMRDFMRCTLGYSHAVPDGPPKTEHRSPTQCWLLCRPMGHGTLHWRRRLRWAMMKVR